MSQQEAPSSPEASRQRALVVLLGDEDTAVRARIESTLLATPADTLRWLPHFQLHADPVIRRRVRHILEQLQSQEAEADLLVFLLQHGERFDLEDAVWRFVRVRYPETSVTGYQALLDLWADEIRTAWLAALRDQTLSGQERLTLLNAYLFDHLGFRGNEADYFDPDNSYLNRVMDRRTGNPIALCLLYQFLGQRLALSIRGIGMPGHFLCRYQTSQEEFYIDAFHGGRLLSRTDCIRKLKHFAMEYDETVLQPISPRRTLQRMVANLHLIHKERRNQREVERLQRYLVALTH